MRIMTLQNSVFSAALFPPESPERGAPFPDLKNGSIAGS
jgi:hypothetical protein